MIDWDKIDVKNLTEEDIQKLAIEFFKMEREEFNSLLPDTNQIEEF